MNVSFKKDSLPVPILFSSFLPFPFASLPLLSLPFPFLLPPFSLKRFHGHWADASLLPSDYKNTVFRLVLGAGGSAEYDAILKSYYATEDNQERKYAMFSLGAASDPELKVCVRTYQLTN